ncbi:MAG: hypothetical protein ACP5SI_01760 [Chloroflexia bacterium]
MTPDASILWLSCTALLALAFPAGLGWMSAGNRSQQEPQGGRLLAATLLAGLVAATVGFPLLYGAAHFPALGESAHASWQWQPFGEGSGLLAWDGLGVRNANTPARAALLLLQVSGTLCVVTISLLPVLRRLWAPGWIAAMVAIAGLLYPLLAHWVWGEGWLAQTGLTGYLGHGFVDPGGAGVHYGLGGLLALASLLATGARRRGAVREGSPPLGAALLAFAGMCSLQLGSLRSLSPQLATAALNTLASAASGGIAAAVYMAFTTTRLRADMLARGLLAGTAAAAGLAPFAPVGTLAGVGAVAGLLMCLGSYLVERVWKLDDSAGLISIFGLCGLWGVLAVGLFADGRCGAGWNGVGTEIYLGVAGQGVTGIALVAPGMARDFGQLAAQLLGIATILAWGLGLGWVVFRLASVRRVPR